MTERGEKVIAKAVGGRTLTFTRMEYGDGVLEGLKDLREESGIRELYRGVTSLVSKKADLGISKTVTDGFVTTVTGKLVPGSVTEDFTAKELAVYGRVDDEREELIAYFGAVDYLNFKKKDVSDYISAVKALSLDHRAVVNIATGSADLDIRIEYNPDTYAPLEDFDTLKEDFAAHKEENRTEIDALKEDFAAHKVSPRSTNFITLANNAGDLVNPIQHTAIASGMVIAHIVKSTSGNTCRLFVNEALADAFPFYASTTVITDTCMTEITLTAFVRKGDKITITCDGNGDKYSLANLIIQQISWYE